MKMLMETVEREGHLVAVEERLMTLKKAFPSHLLQLSWPLRHLGQVEQEAAEEA
jgi:hypothetical protein